MTCFGVYKHDISCWVELFCAPQVADMKWKEKIEIEEYIEIPENLNWNYSHIYR